MSHLLLFFGDHEGEQNPPPQGGLGQSWFVLDFQVDYDGYSPKTPGGATPRGTFGPAFERAQESWSFSGQVRLRRQAPLEVVLRVPGVVALQRRRSFAFAGRREVAARIVMARRDDEEFLLLL